MDHSLFDVEVGENLGALVNKGETRMEFLYYREEIDNSHYFLRTKLGSVSLEVNNYGMKRLEEKEMTLDLPVVDAKELEQVTEGQVHKFKQVPVSDAGSHIQGGQG